MLKRLMIGVVIPGVLGVATYVASPAVRSHVKVEWSSRFGWTQAAREADPAGFADYASKKLAEDLKSMQKAQHDLAASMTTVGGKLREQNALLNEGRRLAEEFRAKYHEANGKFPVEVRGAAYTEPQLKSQLSMVLAENAGYEDSVSKLQQLKEKAEAEVAALVVRINATESQLAALTAKREMLRLQSLTAEGQQLLAQVDTLMNENSQVDRDNPVRTVRELMAAADHRSQKVANHQSVEDFLAAKPKPADQPSAEATATPAKPKVKPVSSRKEKEDKPIFRQF